MDKFQKLNLVRSMARHFPINTVVGWYVGEEINYGHVIGYGENSCGEPIVHVKSFVNVETFDMKEVFLHTENQETGLFVV